MVHHDHPTYSPLTYTLSQHNLCLRNIRNSDDPSKTYSPKVFWWKVLSSFLMRLIQKNVFGGKALACADIWGWVAKLWDQLEFSQSQQKWNVTEMMQMSRHVFRLKILKIIYLLQSYNAMQCKRLINLVIKCNLCLIISMCKHMHTLRTWGPNKKTSLLWLLGEMWESMIFLNVTLLTHMSLFIKLQYI